MRAGSFQLCGKLFGDCILISYMAKKKSLLKLRKGLDLNHTAHSGTHMTNIIATHGNHHNLGDSAVGIVESSGH